ncbi:MAG: hypothetical protein KGI73_03680 [Patescibacteria group bacterium]|nr:hypothetical protein [Patescibacteria group bacterium]
MDELEIQGKKYISSKRASELTGYAKDYIGQLARSGKIPGHRMGRAWYVDASALLGHSGTEGESAVPTEQALSTEVSSAPAPLAPAPSIPSPFTVHRLRAESGRVLLNKRRAVTPAMLRTMGISKREFPASWVTPIYFTDNGELLPHTKHTQYEQAVRYQPEAGSTKITLTKVVEEKNKTITAPATPHRIAAPVAMDGLIFPARLSDEKDIRISDKREEVKKGKDISLILSGGAVLAAMGVLLFFSAGIFVSSNITFQGVTSPYTANLIVGYQYVADFLAHYPPLQIGLGAMGAFFSVIVASFWTFFYNGVGFFVNLVRMALGN